MDALQELRIKAETARTLGHNEYALGLEAAMATLGAKPQQEMALAVSPEATKPPKSHHRRRWLPTEQDALRLDWSPEGGEMSVPDLAAKYRRSPIAIYHQAVYGLKLPLRAKDRPYSQFEGQNQ